MADVEIVEHDIQIGDLTFNVAEAGSGSPVILLHGWPDSWHLWHSQIQSLARSGHRVVAPDLRGFGQSAAPEAVSDYSLHLLINDVAAVMDEFTIERAVVVGHDWGAVLAWLVATFLPERVERLVCVSVGHPQAFSGAGFIQKQLSWYMLWFQFPGVAESAFVADDWELFCKWAHNGARRGSDDYMERQIADLSRPGRLSAGFNWYRANINPENFAGDGRGVDLPPVTCPTMGVWSSGDMALSEVQMTESHKYVSGPWRYERIEVASHWIPVYASDELNALLEEFLAV
jgi:pimeloyl-ACP methyl ester carboxylesterase